ncbi:MAG: hypothetical protein GY854_30430 [Deltaproteobacteria bacterium]|nr:hypothetical protein [Deltaproteobacteria bacterium]
MLGDSLVFHPGLGVEGGYDTNPLRLNEDVQGAGRLRITPYLDLATRSKKQKIKDEGVVESTPPKVDFRFGLAGWYDMFFAKDAAVDDQDHFGVDTHLNFILFPEGTFSLLADAMYLRSLQPYESSEEHWAWHMIKPGLGFQLRPGGGTLTFELGYRLSLMLYEDSNLAKTNNKMTHDVRFQTSWKIMPKTALITRVNFSPNIYTKEPGGTIVQNNDSMPVRGLFGIQGLLSPKFGLSLFVGYGASFYETGDDFDHLLAQGELMFFITPTANIRLGGQRDFVDSYYANYYTKTGGYLKYEQMFGGIFLASLKGDVFYRGYSTMLDTGGDFTPSSNSRGDVWIGGTLLLEVRLTDWLSIHASGKYSGDVSDFQYESEEWPNVAVSFHRFEALLGVRGHY